MPPPLSIYSPRVQSLIKRLRTPAQVQRWLQSLHYNATDTMHSIEMVVKTQSAHCLEGSMAAAAILEQHGHPPRILDLESKDLLDHTLFLFQEKGKFGTVGKSHDAGLDGRRPVFTTVRTLVKSYAIPYIDEKAEMTSFGVLDLRTLPRQTWRTSNRSVWYVEEALRHVPHYPVRTPKATIQQWRRRWIDFRQIHPHQQPRYYPDQRSWL